MCINSLRNHVLYVYESLLELRDNLNKDCLIFVYLKTVDYMKGRFYEYYRKRCGLYIKPCQIGIQ
jgi:hypothetical protein